MVFNFTLLWLFPLLSQGQILLPAVGVLQVELLWALFVTSIVDLHKYLS
jgi:hypothetical protein